MAAVAVSQIWQGNSNLAELEEMKNWYKKSLGWRKDMHSRQKFKSALPAIHVPMGDMFY
jgi:hypothetical protein